MITYILIIMMAGHPEQVVRTPAETIPQCTAAGERVVANYSRIYNLQPHEISYRCIPIVRQ